ncbi:copper transport protein ATOX1 isoform X1 [Micropterus salmoides]|uniref:copper transport protein ATOX1 isoform X1 n=1 Tax=Micropterus salmoides TaxID=27706 RepID=UPI0018ED9A69|nr:copper transport protein ATOX1 isoform X1 [Micropterus salmoides]
MEVETRNYLQAPFWKQTIATASTGEELLKKHEFEVAMTCEGCSGAVTRVLNKLGDVKFEIDLPKKLVWIESDKDVDVLMETLKKCGKEVKYNGPK